MEAEHPGDPDHHEHEAYLLELGQAIYAVSGLAGIAFDVLRVHGGFDSAALYDDPLGALENRLRSNPPDLERIDAFIDLLSSARIARNDLVHALPVKHGLHRRRTKDSGYVKNFYSIESLRDARELFERPSRRGNQVLYSDGGDAIKRWYRQPTQLGARRTP